MKNQVLRYVAIALLSFGSLVAGWVLAVGVAVNSDGITFPDGTSQSTAFLGLYGTPDEIFHSGCEVTKATQTSVGRCTVARTVPAGKRLVIETVTGLGYATNYILGTAYLGYWVELGSDRGPMHVKNAFPWLEQAESFSTRRFFGFNYSGHLYVNGPETLQFDVYGGSSTGTSDYSIEYSVSGYLVDIIP